MKLDYEKVREEVVRENVKDSAIKQIANMNLAKYWKYGVAERTLNPISREIFRRYLDIPEPRVRLSDTFRDQCELLLKDIAFQRHEFNARKKNVEPGDNAPMKIKKGLLEGERTFQYAGKHRGRTGSYDQSLYALIFHRTKPQIMYRFNDMKKPDVIDLRLCHYFRMQLAEVKYQLKGPEDYRWISDNITYSMIRVSSVDLSRAGITWDEKEKAFQKEGLGVFHVTRLWVDHSDILEFKRNVVTQFLRRKKSWHDGTELDKAYSVYVTREHSLSAGNCEEHTDKFIASVQRKRKKLIDYVVLDDHERVVAIRGDKLLELRNDSYSRGAVKQAIVDEMM